MQNEVTAPNVAQLSHELVGLRVLYVICRQYIEIFWMKIKILAQEYNNF